MARAPAGRLGADHLPIDAGGSLVRAGRARDVPDVGAARYALALAVVGTAVGDPVRAVQDLLGRRCPVRLS